MGAIKSSTFKKQAAKESFCVVVSHKVTTTLIEVLTNVSEENSIQCLRTRTVTNDVSYKEVISHNSLSTDYRVHDGVVSLFPFSAVKLHMV